MAIVVKNLPASAGDARDVGLIPGLGRSPERGHGNLLQYSCLGKSMDKGAWQATVHGVTKSRTRLSDFYQVALVVKNLPANAGGLKETRV